MGGHCLVEQCLCKRESYRASTHESDLSDRGRALVEALHEGVGNAGGDLLVQRGVACCGSLLGGTLVMGCIAQCALLDWGQLDRLRL